MTRQADSILVQVEIQIWLQIVNCSAWQREECTLLSAVLVLKALAMPDGIMTIWWVVTAAPFSHKIVVVVADVDILWPISSYHESLTGTSDII